MLVLPTVFINGSFIIITCSYIGGGKSSEICSSMILHYIKVKRQLNSNIDPLDGEYQYMGDAANIMSNMLHKNYDKNLPCSSLRSFHSLL